MRHVLSIMLMALSGSNSLIAAQKKIDPDHSSLTIHVGKSGLLGVAGHEHTVIAPLKDGTIDDGQPSYVGFRVDAARLTVLPEDHQAEIQRSMQDKVLESTRFPEIRFRSDSVQPVVEDSWIVRHAIAARSSEGSAIVGAQESREICGNDHDQADGLWNSTNQYRRGRSEGEKRPEDRLLNRYEIENRLRAESYLCDQLCRSKPVPEPWSVTAGCAVSLVG